MSEYYIFLLWENFKNRYQSNPKFTMATCTTKGFDTTILFRGLGHSGSPATAKQIYELGEVHLLALIRKGQAG